jgi:hexokinase
LISRPCCYADFSSYQDLGEIVRNILLYLIDNSLLFDGHSTQILNTHYGFDAAFVSAVEGAKSSSEVRDVIAKDLNVQQNITDRDVELVQWASRAVASRASTLAACAIAAVIKHTKALDKSGPIDIGVDGSVAEFLPFFEERVRVALRDVLGEEGEKRVVIGLAKDGSGVGGKLYPGCRVASTSD